MSCLVNDTSTTSKRSIWPEEMRELWVLNAWESKLTLSNRKDYNDWASALGANTLGYGHLEDPLFMPAASLPWQIEHGFAEEFCAAMNTEAVRFFKSGSDAVSCAVRLARAYTKRKYTIVFDKCYHGTASDFRPIIWSQDGYPSMTDTIKMPFGEEVRSGLLPHTAAIVVEPVPKAIGEPPPGWLRHLREVTDKYGALLITDEIILGYRHSLRGYLTSAGVEADISCYGKAMGQGAAISACTGRRDILGLLAKDVHFSGTNNGEPLPLHIARETLNTYIREDVCAKLNAKGLRLKLLLNAAGFNTKGLNSRFEVTGCDMDMTRFCFERGILFPGWCSMAVSHTDEQMEGLVDALVDYRTHISGK